KFQMKRRAYDSRVRRAGAARTRRRILMAAKRLFSTQGFDTVTIDRLASEAGVAAPTIYAIFRSKGGVLEALIREAAFGDRYEALVDAALASSDPRAGIRMCASIARTVFDSRKSEIGMIRGAAALSRELRAIEAKGERQ